MLNVHLRWRPLTTTGGFSWEFSAFYDWGLIANPYSPVGVPGRYSLSGWGLGVAIDAPHGIRLSAVVARRIGSNPGANALTRFDQDGSLDRTRLWQTAALNF